MNNSTKVWLFILGTSLFLLVLGYQLGGRLGLFIGFLMAIAFNIMIFFFGEDRLLTKMSARPAKGQDAWGLNSKAERFSNLVGIECPRIYIFPSESITCFCTSQRLGRGSIAFSEGLLLRLRDEELEAIVAHQICQINRMDNFAFSASSTIANSLVGFGSLLDRYLPFRFFETLLSPLGWLIIKPISPANSFYQTDTATIELLDNRFVLGKVLWKLEGYAQSLPLDIPPCTSHLFITHPQSIQQKNIFLKLHPPIEFRLQNLMGYFPP